MIRFKIFICLMISTLSYGQDLDNLMIKEGDDGNHIYLSDQAISHETPYLGYEKVEISRATNGKSFKFLATVARPETQEEFISIFGEANWNSFLNTKNLDYKSGWQFILDHPRLDDYGFLAIDPKFRQAMGTGYLDKSAVDAKDGTKFTYQAKYISTQADSSITRKGALSKGLKPAVGQPKVLKTVERDSLITVKWYNTFDSAPEAFAAKVYRQEGGSGDYESLSSKLMANHVGDSIVYALNDQVVPEHMYRYFIVPATMEGLAGNPSDTVTSISVNLARIPLIKNAQAKDTTNGLHISWDSIAYKPYWAGIEISRSRDARGNFIRLDTLASTSREFMDTRVKPNIVYYYRLKALTVLNDTVSASGITSGVHFNKNQPPLAPVDLTASREGDNIRLKWENNTEEDLSGYYVLRVSKARDTFNTVSALIHENTFLDTTRLRGRKTYTDVVQAMNQSDLMSPVSNEISIRPLNTQKPEIPNGLVGYSEPSGVSLSWKNTRDLDPLIKGYNLYRKSTTTVVKEDIYSISALKSQGYEKINTSVIERNTFEDMQVELGNRYVYMLTAVDIYDKESDATTYLVINVELPDLNPPVGFSARKTSKGIILNWSTTNQIGAKGYTVYRRTAETEPIILSQLPLNENEFIDANGKSGKLYFYTIVVRGDQDKKSVKSKEKGVRY